MESQQSSSREVLELKAWLSDTESQNLSVGLGPSSWRTLGWVGLVITRYRLDGSRGCATTLLANSKKEIASSHLQLNSIPWASIDNILNPV
jgi:hypothetical protein